MAFGKYAVDYEERVNYEHLRKERLDRAKARINQDGLGALVTWDEANIRYLTSYYITTPMRPSETQCVFIPRNGEPIQDAASRPWIAKPAQASNRPQASPRPKPRRAVADGKPP